MVRSAFRSLQHRNARLFFTGMLVSNVGTWMQQTALVLLVLKISGKGTDLGLITACQFGPQLLLGPYAGVVADRFNRRHLTIATQSLLTVHAFVLAIVDVAGWARLSTVAVLSLVLGTLNTVDNPARRGLVTEMVDVDDVSSALSLNTAVMTGARVFGPALAGFVVHLFGTAWCFAGNGVSFLAVLAGLVLMNPGELRAPTPAPRGGRPVRDAVGFIRRDPLLSRTFVALAIVSTFAYNYTVSLPLLVERNLSGGDLQVGWLLAVNSVGSVIGSLAVAARRAVGALSLTLALVVLGGSSLALGAAPTMLVALALAIPVGAGGAGFVAITSGITQPRTSPAMRGRVLAFQSTAFLGSTFIGGPITGWIADRLGAGWSVSYGGLAALAVASGFWLSVRHLRGRGHAEPATALAP